MPFNLKEAWQNTPKEDQYSMIGAGANMVGQLGATGIDTFGRKDSRFVNVNQEAAKGTLRGAGTGAMLGANPLLAGATGGLSIVAGAVIGGAVGGISSGVGAKKQQKETAEHYKDIYYGKDSDKMYFPYAGGSKFAMGGNLANQMPVEVDGNSHEQGGVPLGVSNNEVEGNEVIWNNFVFSDRLPYDDSITFADQAKKIMKKYKGREGDTYSSKSMKNEMERLKAAHQDALTAMEQQLQAEQQQDMDDVAQYGDAINADESGKFSVDPAMQQQMFEMAKQRGVGMNQLTNKIGMNKFRYGGMIKQYYNGGPFSRDGKYTGSPIMVGDTDYSYLMRPLPKEQPYNGLHIMQPSSFDAPIRRYNAFSPDTTPRSIAPKLSGSPSPETTTSINNYNATIDPVNGSTIPIQTNMEWTNLIGPPKMRDDFTMAQSNPAVLNSNNYDDLDKTQSSWFNPVASTSTATPSVTPTSSGANIRGNARTVSSNGINKDVTGGKKGPSTPADRFRFGREEAALMASSTAALDNIMKGLKPEVSRLKRVSFERLNLEDLRRLNRINADRGMTQTSKSIRGSGRSSGEVLAGLSAAGSAITSSRMGQDAQSYLQEEQANNQISNQEVQTNNQIAMQEYMNNEQNRAMAKSVGNLGLANLGQNYQGYLRDKTLNEKNMMYNQRVLDLMEDFVPNFKYVTDPVEKEKLKLQFVQGLSQMMKNDPNFASMITQGKKEEKE